MRRLLYSIRPEKIDRYPDLAKPEPVSRNEGRLTFGEDAAFGKAGRGTRTTSTAR
jgi:hypothetical protein